MLIATPLLIFLLYLQAVDVSGLCNCQVSSGDLTCDPGTIQSFPEDLADCNVNYKAVTRIELFLQPIKQVGDNAFSSFTEVTRIALALNEELSELSGSSFEGLTKLRSLVLQSNNISNIPRGMLDSLVALDQLDLDNNPLDSPYEANAWHFCDRLYNPIDGLQVVGNLTVEKHLKWDAYSEDYCNARNIIDQQSHIVEECGAQQVNGTLTCQQSENIARIACQIQGEPVDYVIFEFKSQDYHSSKTRIVDNFAECETDDFFRSFNYDPSEAEDMKLMRSFTLYATKYDLSDLAQVTGKLTEAVTIYADTVFLNKPLQTLNHTLTIRARKVIIDFPIVMKMPKSAFVLDGSASSPVEPFAQAEEHITVNNALTLRWRKYGYLDILDEVDTKTNVITSKECQPQAAMADAALIDTTDWFDIIAINLKYVCARTLLSTKSNNQLLADMSTFSLDYASDKSLIADLSAFTASQKFKRVLEMLEKPFIHNVPAYSIDVISDMSHIMHAQMSAYRLTEIATELQIGLANAKMVEMDAHFSIVEAQQTLYFETEMAILESIFSAVNSSWHWNFNHREKMKELIQSNLDAVMDVALQLKEQEYEQMLKEAQTAVVHMTEVVDKYQEDVNRYVKVAEASMDLQQKEMDRVKETGDEMSRQFDNFEVNVEEYKEEQQAKACRGIFGGLAKIGSAFAVGLFYPPGYAKCVELTVDAGLNMVDLMDEMEDIYVIVDEIDKMMDDINIDDLANVSVDMSAEFSVALKNAYDLKDKASDFDEIEAMGEIQLGYLDEATDHQIKDMDKLMLACRNFADSAQRLTGETSDFADKMLMLAEKNGDLNLAKQDLERAIGEVEDIKKMIDNLETVHQDYVEQMQENEAAYEAAVAKLQAGFNTATAAQLEAFKSDITTKFNAFQDTFDTVRNSYRQQLSDLTVSIKMRRYGLKEYSMAQRSMLMALFTDYCDGKFYNSFTLCLISEAPSMSDDFEVLLDKLFKIEWGTLTSTDNFQPPPETFFSQIELKDNASTWHYPVETLRNHCTLDVNLLQLDTTQRFDDFWRIRIALIRMVLLDLNGQPIPSPGLNLGQEIQVFITFPKIFNDTDSDRQHPLFLGQTHFCTADYVTIPGDIQFRSSCMVSVEFNNLNFKPSVDGIFTLTIVNADKINMDQLGSLRIEFAGTRIPFPLGDLK